jgi:hypothetical protein
LLSGGGAYCLLASCVVAGLGLACELWQEWENSVALFINVYGEGYKNAFLNGGEEITWFAQVLAGTRLLYHRAAVLPKVVYCCAIPVLACSTQAGQGRARQSRAAPAGCGSDRQSYLHLHLYLHLYLPVLCCAVPCCAVRLGGSRGSGKARP